MPCAHCKQTGHNKRTCPYISKEMVAEEEMMEEVEKRLFLPSELEDGENEEETEESESEDSEDEDEEEEEEEEIDIELVRKESDLYRKNGYDDEGKRAAVLPESFFGPKKKKVAKKKAAPKKKKVEIKGMKGAVELIMKQQKKAKKRKVVDIDTTGLKVERSIAELLVRSGRMIDQEYIKEVGFGDDE